jgi:hypothetical protein
LELLVKQDLNGIGPDQRGILPAGSYKARGTYSGLLDEFKVPDQIKAAPEETISKLREAYDFAAFLENWQDQWDLRITGEDGWQQNRQMLEKTLKKDGAAEK